MRGAHVHRWRQGQEGDAHAHRTGIAMETAPTVPAEDRPEELLERVQELQDRLDSVGDPASRKIAEELVSAVVQMYGAGLERILERMLAAGEAGERIAVGLTDDEFLGTLLLI